MFLINNSIISVLIKKHIETNNTLNMFFLTILKYIVFCSLVTSRPLQTEQVNKSQYLSKRARPYSVVPVDGSADRTSSTPIKTKVVTRMETAVATKVVTVPADPVTQTVFLIISTEPNDPDMFQSTIAVNANSGSISAQDQPTPATTTDRSALHSPSEVSDKISKSSSPTSTPAAKIADGEEERSSQTLQPYLHTYRWSNSTSSTHDGSVSTINDNVSTMSSYL